MCTSQGHTPIFGTTSTYRPKIGRESSQKEVDVELLTIAGFRYCLANRVANIEPLKGRDPSMRGGEARTRYRPVPHTKAANPVPESKTANLTLSLYKICTSITRVPRCSRCQRDPKHEVMNDHACRIGCLEPWSATDGQDELWTLRCVGNVFIE